MPNPVLVLGLGNTLFSDDGAGILAVREARAHWEGGGVDFEEAAAGGLELLDRLTGYRAALVVDAAVTGQARPGEHYLVNPDSLGARMIGGAHGAHLGTALGLAANMGVPMPAHVEVLAIEARDVATPSEQPTRAVAAAIPRVAATILSLAASLLEEVQEHA